MKKLHCAICSKNKKFEKPKISYLKNISPFYYLHQCKDEREK